MNKFLLLSIYLQKPSWAIKEKDELEILN